MWIIPNLSRGVLGRRCQSFRSTWFVPLLILAFLWPCILSFVFVVIVLFFVFNKSLKMCKLYCVTLCLWLWIDKVVCLSACTHICRISHSSWEKHGYLTAYLSVVWICETLWCVWFLQPVNNTHTRWTEVQKDSLTIAFDVRSHHRKICYMPISITVCEGWGEMSA